MTAFPLARLSDARLVEEFTALARKAGSAVLDSEVSEANRAIRGMWAIENVLRSRGREARQQLVPLLDHQDRFVRYYAAKELLGLAPERARAVIEWNAKYGFDAIAGDAKGFLRAFDTGKFKPD
jgi:hypothetical protein